MTRRCPLPSDLTHRPFTVSEAIAAGVPAHRMFSHDLARPFHGVRVDARWPDDYLSRCEALSARLKPEHFFSHMTAARLHGFPLPVRLQRERELHVSSFAPVRPPRVTGVVGHSANRARTAVVEVNGLRAVSVSLAWCQLAPVLTLDELIVAGDRLLGRPRALTSRSEITGAVRAYGQAHGSRRLRAAASLIRERVESPRESWLRLALVRAGLPEPDVNVPILDSSGTRIAIGDLVYPSSKVLVEYDGEQHRTDDRQYARDVVRLNDIAAEGWLTIRVDKHMTFDEACVRTRRALYVRGGLRDDRLPKDRPGV